MGETRRYNSPVPKRSPYHVLGVDLDATATTIRAAWRRLARQHHPDLTGGDAAASQAATRQMAEINAAYEELRDPVRRRAAADKARGDERRAGRSGSDARTSASSTADAAETAEPDARRSGGPPR